MEYAIPRKFKFTKNQWRFIMLLNAVIVILLVPYFILQIIPSSAPPYTPTGGQPYARERDARISLNPSIYWETNLGGSGTDIPAAVVNHGTHFHALVVSNSTDYDFELDEPDTHTQRLFLATLSPNGRTKDFRLLAGGISVDVVKAMAWGNEILVLYNVGNTAHLRRIACDGTVVRSYTSSNRRGVDFMVDRRAAGRIVLAVQQDRTPFATTLTLYVLNENLNLDTTAARHTMTTDSMPRSLDFTSMFPSVSAGGGYIVFARDKNELHPAVIEFGTAFNPVYHSLRFAALPDFVATDIVPYSDGGIGVFIMAGTAGGAPHLITVRLENGVFAANTMTPLAAPLNMTAATAVRFLLVDSGDDIPNKFILATHNNGSAVRKLLPNSASLAPQNSLSDFAALSSVAFAADFLVGRPLPLPMRETLLFGTDTSGSLFLTRLTNETALPLITFGGSGTETAISMTLADGGIIIAAATNSAADGNQDGDIGGNFGGIDAWLAFVPL